MVLYCIVHSGNILRAFVHKFRYHPEDEAVFIVDKEVNSRYCPPVEKVKYYQMPHPLRIADDSWPNEKIKEHTNKTLAEFLQKIGVDPRQASHIYAMFDGYNPFTLYFELNSIKYMLIELVDNQFNSFAASNTAFFVKYHEIVKELHLSDACGQNCIKGYLLSDESERYAIEDKVELEVYDYYKTLVSLDSEHKRQLIEGYGIDRCDFNAVMLLNSQIASKRRIKQFRSSLSNAGEGDVGDFCSFYKTVFDYYFSGMDFALKLHPETSEDFERAFSEYKQLPKEVPVEAFILLDKKFDVFCPAVSTGIRIFEKNDFNVVNFGKLLFGFIRQIHFVFLAFTLINAVCPPSKMFTYRIAPEQLNIFADWVYKENKDAEFQRLTESNVEEAAFILADDPDDGFMDLVRYAPEDCLIIFSGSRITDERLFAKQEMIYSIIDVSGEKEVPRRMCCWTVMSKNRGLVGALKDFSASYLLEKSKLKIQSEPHN